MLSVAPEFLLEDLVSNFAFHRCKGEFAMTWFIAWWNLAALYAFSNLSLAMTSAILSRARVLEILESVAAKSAGNFWFAICLLKAVPSLCCFSLLRNIMSSGLTLASTRQDLLRLAPGCLDQWLAPKGLMRPCLGANLNTPKNLCKIPILKDLTQFVKRILTLNESRLADASWN